MRPDHLGQRITPNPTELVDGSWINILPFDTTQAQAAIDVTWIYGINKNTGIDALIAFGSGPNVSLVTDLGLRMVCGIGQGGANFQFGDAPLELPPEHCLFAKLVAFDETAISAMSVGAGVQVNAIGYTTRG